MALDFPTSPTNGQTYAGANGLNYIYDSALGVWKVYGVPGTQVWYATTPPGSATAYPFWWNTNEGRLYIYYVAESAWVEASPAGTVTGNSLGRPDVPPILSTFTIANQGSRVLTQYASGFAIRSDAASGGITIAYQSTPTPPYSIIGRMRLQCLSVNFRRGGFGWYDTAGGRVQLLGPIHSTSWIYERADWTTLTSFNAATSLGSAVGNIAEWQRLRDDGTNRYYDISNNGYDWINLWSAGRTNWLTPNAVGFTIETSTTAGGTVAHLFSWEVGT